MSQKQFLPISEVKWDLGKKQWQSAPPQQHAIAQERCDLQNKDLGRLPVKRRRRRRRNEDGTHLEQRLFDKGNRKKTKNADGGLEHLLILADSAELLLESGTNCHIAKGINQCRGGQINTIVPQLQNGLSNPKGQRPLESPLNAVRDVDNVLAVTVFPLRGRIRLSQLRRQARLKNHQLVQETRGHLRPVHVDHKNVEDAQDVQMVAADQVEEVMGPQDVEALVAKCYSQMVEGIQEDQIHEELDQRCTAVLGLERVDQFNTNYAAQGGYKQIEHRRQEPCVSEPLQIIVGQHQPTMPHPINTCQPVQMTNGPLLRTDEWKDPFSEQHTSGSQPDQLHGLAKDHTRETSEIETQVPLHMSEAQKDRQRIARHQRMLRTYQRRKRLREKLWRAAQQGYLMADAQRGYKYEAEQQWHWHMWNVQSWRLWEAEQQRLLHMSHQEREQYRMVQRTGHQIEEQKASQNVVPGMDQVGLQLEVSHDSQEPSTVKCHKDQSLEQLIDDPVKALEEAERATSCVSVIGRTRLNQLKCEARLRNTDVLERNHD